MINHFCDECQYRYVPESVLDYYKKTYTMPDDIRDWGVEYKKQKFWLCENTKIAKVDKRNGYVLMRPCNNNGHCPYFRTPDAEDIIPSTLSLTASASEVTEGDEVTLTMTVTAAALPTDDPDVTTPNTQSISYEYRWYKNERRIFNESESTLTFTAKDIGNIMYECEVIQHLVDVGDGGNKTYSSKKYVVITVNEAEEDTEDTDTEGTDTE